MTAAKRVVRGSRDLNVGLRGGAALAGSILTSVLGAPLETAFSSLVLEGGYGITMLAAIVVMAVITVPVAWVFYSR